MCNTNQRNKQPNSKQFQRTEIQLVAFILFFRVFVLVCFFAKFVFWRRQRHRWWWWWCCVVFHTNSVRRFVNGSSAFKQHDRQHFVHSFLEINWKRLKRVLPQWYRKTYCRQNSNSMLIKRMCIVVCAHLVKPTAKGIYVCIIYIYINVGIYRNTPPTGMNP